MCADRNDSVVRYTLAGAPAPLAVAGYTYDALPDAVRELVPTDDQLDQAVTATFSASSSLTVGKPVDPAES